MMKQLVLSVVVLMVVSLNALATDYYVDNTAPGASDSNDGLMPTSVGGSGPWLTVGKCASTMVAGDTCVIVNAGGIYNERVTETTSGTAGNRITYQCQGGGVRAKIRGFTISGSDYITIAGCELTHAGMTSEGAVPTILANTSQNIEIMDNFIHDTNWLGIRCSGAAASACVNLTIASNTISVIGSLSGTCGSSCRTQAIQVWADGLLIEGNTFSHSEDYIIFHSNSATIRGNFFGVSVAADGAGNQHLDAVQSGCNSNPPNESWNKVLIEGNTLDRMDPTASHTHFGIINDNNSCPQSGPVILRYNTVFDVGGGGYGGDRNNASNADHKIYNNTWVDNHQATDGLMVNVNGTDNASVKSNLCFNCVQDSSPDVYLLKASSGSEGDCNLGYISTNPSAGWANPIASEPNNILNLDPLFNDYGGNDFTLRSGSPAIDAGCALTNVNSADLGSGVSLSVDDASFFQDGWGGVSPDCIAVGTVSNTACIASIDYGTDTITLTSAISRSNGDAVWLFTDSSGGTVLHGSAPDIGAFEFNAVIADTVPPTVTITAPTGD